MPFSLPDLTRTAIAARIAELSATAQRVLGAASVLGVALDLELLAAVTEFDRGVVEDSLAEAERRQLVRFDGMRYAFAAGIIAEVVRRECVTPGVRTGIQQRALAALVGRSDLESAVLRAELMARLEPGSAAFDQAVSVARATMATESPRTGRRAIAAAERAAGTDRSPEQVRIIEELKAQATGGTTDGH